jgi:hypothetical protein
MNGSIRIGIDGSGISTGISMGINMDMEERSESDQRYEHR